MQVVSIDVYAVLLSTCTCKLYANRKYSEEKLKNSNLTHVQCPFYTVIKFESFYKGDCWIVVSTISDGIGLQIKETTKTYAPDSRRTLR